MSRVLVYAASGLQGGAVAQELIAAGEGVRLVTRSEQSVAHLKAAGAEVAVADMADPAALDRANRGIDRVALTVPLTFDGPQMLAAGRNAVTAAARAGVRLLVYNAGIAYPDRPAGDEFLDETIAGIAHSVRSSGLAAVVLRSPLYLDNLSAPWTLPAIRNRGVIAYPVRAELSLPWASHRNAARFVASALRRPDLAGRVLDIADPEPVNVGRIAEAVARSIGRAVRYEAITPEQFGERVRPALGDRAAEHMATLYRLIDRDDGALLKRQHGEAYSLLGPDLEKVEAWAARSFARQE